MEETRNELANGIASMLVNPRYIAWFLVFPLVAAGVGEGGGGAHGRRVSEQSFLHAHTRGTKAPFRSHRAISTVSKRSAPTTADYSFRTLGPQLFSARSRCSRDRGSRLAGSNACRVRLLFVVVSWDGLFADRTDEIGETRRGLIESVVIHGDFRETIDPINCRFWSLIECCLARVTLWQRVGEGGARRGS